MKKYLFKVCPNNFSKFLSQIENFSFLKIFHKHIFLKVSNQMPIALNIWEDPAISPPAITV